MDGCRPQSAQSSRTPPAIYPFPLVLFVPFVVRWESSLLVQAVALSGPAICSHPGARGAAGLVKAQPCQSASATSSSFWSCLSLSKCS